MEPLLEFLLLPLLNCNKFNRTVTLRVTMNSVLWRSRCQLWANTWLTAPTTLLPTKGEPTNREVLRLPCRLYLCCQKVFPYRMELTNADGTGSWLTLALMSLSVLLLKVEARNKFTSVFATRMRPTYSASLTTCLGAMCPPRHLALYVHPQCEKCCLVSTPSASLCRQYSVPCTYVFTYNYPSSIHHCHIETALPHLCREFSCSGGPVLQ